MSNRGASTYSYRDTTGAITLNGVPYQFTGQKGVRRIGIIMTTERTTMDVAADGAVMTNYLAGDNGAIELECQQTSSLHRYLLTQYNVLKTLADQGGIAQWAAGFAIIRNGLDGSAHEAKGIAFSKIPDKAYAAAGGYLTWRLMVSDLQSL